MLFAFFEITSLIAYALMIVGFVVMILGIKDLNKKSNARVIMIVGAALVFGGVGFSVFAMKSNKGVKRVERNAHAFLDAKAEKAASYTAERFPEGGTVAFLIDDESNNNSESDNRYVLESIRKRLSERGFTCDEVLVVGESKDVVDKKTGETNTVIEDPTDATIMKKKLDSLYDKVDMVFNFVGLPQSVADVKKITFLTRKNTATGKNNMMLLCDTGLPYVEQDMLKKSRVCAIIDYISYSGNEFDMQKNSVPKDLSDAFDLMYFFVNADTLENYTDENPGYFVTK